MGKLLKVNLVNLFQSLTFWISVIGLVFVEYLFSMGAFIFEDNVTGEDVIGYMAMGTTIQLVFCGLIVPFIIGFDFKGGMIRNKIIVGYTKMQIYFANLIVSIFAASILIIISYVCRIVKLCSLIGWASLKWLLFNSVFSDVFGKVVLYNLLAAIGVTVLSCSISMVIQKTSVSVIVLISTAFAFMFFIGPLLKLYAYEDRPTRTFTNSQGVTVTYENEYYIENPKLRKLVVGLESADFVSTIQSGNYPLYAEIYYGYYYEKDGTEEENEGIPTRYITGTAISTIVIGVLGIYCFKKRNIK